MIRRLPFLIIAIATFLAAEPLLHQHPLNAGAEAGAAATATCVVCAAGVNRLPDAAPSVIAPAAVSYAVVAVVVLAPNHGVAITLPSRAPPAA